MLLVATCSAWNGPLGIGVVAPEQFAVLGLRFAIVAIAELRSEHVMCAEQVENPGPDICAGSPQPINSQEAKENTVLKLPGPINFNPRPS